MDEYLYKIYDKVDKRYFSIGFRKGNPFYASKGPLTAFINKRKRTRPEEADRYVIRKFKVSDLYETIQ